MKPRDSVRPSVHLIRSSRLKSGDVLVSRPTARADVYQVQIIPVVSHASHRSYEDGIEAGRMLARSLGVNGWFTCDHTHFMAIARRPEPGSRAPQAPHMSNTVEGNPRGDREQRQDQPTDEAQDPASVDRTALMVGSTGVLLLLLTAGCASVAPVPRAAQPPVVATQPAANQPAATPAEPTTTPPAPKPAAAPVTPATRPAAPRVAAPRAPATPPVAAAPTAPAARRRWI